MDGIGNADDEAYVSIFEYGEYNEKITVLRIHLGTGETVANVFPVCGPYNFLTGKLFSKDKDAIVLEVPVSGSNYGAETFLRWMFSPLERPQNQSALSAWTRQKALL
ncbi:hypothetical protein CE91St42_17800 [Oscillospiraceae bacterium]|nr:hypothetical protein CE91St42_17800 [Oscillospiraceae bacterium]